MESIIRARRHLLIYVASIKEKVWLEWSINFGDNFWQILILLG